MSSDDIKNITSWIGGQSVFITGASGFVGKVLVYKLLKSCTNIQDIYLLLRPKRGKTASERLEQLFSSSMFDNMKIDDAETFKKVKMIEGDVTQVKLGISDADWEMLQNNVTLIINAAASVRFDDSLKKAIFTNTRSAKYALLLAKGTKNLKAFVHVSTLYSNCNLSHIPEKFISTGADPETILKLAETLDEHTLEVFTSKILDTYPNTYVYTKNLAEELIYKARHEVPLIIYRPGIVFTSTKEPEPGWCDSLNSLSAFGAAGGKGILRMVYGTEDGSFLLINTDACVNGMIIAAWYRSVYLPAMKKPIDDNIIFNVADFTFTLNFYVKWLHSIELDCSLPDQIFKANCPIVSSSFMYHFWTIFSHLVIGVVLDTILRISGKEPRLVKIYRKIFTALINLKFFMSNQWTIDNDNFKNLAVITPKEEKRIFYADSLFETTFEEVMFNLVFGVRKFLGFTRKPTKEQIERTYRIYIIDIGVRLMLLGLFLWMLPHKSIYEWSVNKFTEYRSSWEQFLESTDEI